MGEIRKFSFSLKEAKKESGVVKLIGRASRSDPSRNARKNNLLFNEKSLSKKHAILGLKLLDPLEPGIDIIDQFRIYVKDLGSTYGIVDLNSQESDPFVVDLKNGERFGLINLDEPVSQHQCRAAKLKFQVNIQYHSSRRGTFICIVKDVSMEDSPMVSRPSTYSKDVRLYGLSSANVGGASLDSTSVSSSEWDYSEEDILFENDTSDSGLDDVLEAYVSEDSSEEEDGEDDIEADVEPEGYTVVNLLSVSELVDDWDIWRADELEKRAEASRGLQSSNFDVDFDLLDQNDDEVDLGNVASDEPTKSYLKHIILSGLIGFTFGVFGSFGILAVLANRTE